MARIIFAPDKDICEAVFVMAFNELKDRDLWAGCPLPECLPDGEFLKAETEKTAHISNDDYFGKAIKLGEDYMVKCRKAAIDKARVSGERPAVPFMDSDLVELYVDHLPHTQETRFGMRVGQCQNQS